MTNFSEINKQASELLAAYKTAKENETLTTSDQLAALFSDYTESKEALNMKDFFRSFDAEKIVSEIDAPEFNKLAGFTAEYKNICFGRCA